MAEEVPIKSRIGRKATVFLGGGRITSALVAGLRLAGYGEPIVVHDRNAGKLRRLRQQFGVEVARELRAAVERTEMLIIAVRPVSVAALLEEVARCGAASRLRIAVSLAAGVPLRGLRTRLGRNVHWIRAMPSPVCRIGRGLTALTFDRKVTTAERKRVQQFFQHVGAVVEIPESRFDVFTAAYSPSHGYHALSVLAKVAEDAGLDGETALTAAAHALADGTIYWRESEESLADLLEEAATPGGTAAATMAAMDRAKYARVVRRGVAAGIRQARQNAKG
jgi:pyrroline-5-carboxylate reductase